MHTSFICLALVNIACLLYFCKKLSPDRPGNRLLFYHSIHKTSSKSLIENVAQLVRFLRGFDDIAFNH